MNAVHGLGALGLMLVSAAAGWVLHAPDTPSAAGPTAAAADAAAARRPQPLSVLAYPQAAAEAAPETVRLHADGSVTVQVQHRPAVWLVAELCRQGARLAPACMGSAAALPVSQGERDADALERALREGDEQRRHEGLLQARAEGRLLPEPLLLDLMRTGPSDRVRLMAFDSYIELKSGDLEALRTGLQAVLRMPYTPLQVRAREQIDGIEALYRYDTALAQRQP
ncbi:hypothetical protein [Azohydromonas caseinilytica]|uniref:Uncharacterized protein n=1 Tax=Azohydromonas caseinilytica TaxID=2728836 RepID=A0A848FKL2_9BURK|nr:hypothetical protein [Azohydromonas caseinilytica]NML18869.1 hypothetical protein [Azohydromonas caseinilytica]